MLFNSYRYILLFLPVTVVVYYFANRISIKAGKIVLIAAGLLFYSLGRTEMLLILGISMAVNYVSAVLIRKCGIKNRYLLALPVIINIALLLYFKYYNFAVSNIDALLGREFHAADIILPLGISFYTFQQISYVSAVTRGELESTDVLDYLTFILFFPKLLMGPLTEPADFIGQINDPGRKRANAENIAYGIRIFSFGLFKKALIADTFAKAVSWIYGNLEVVTAADCILLMLFYTFEIYFDFSGYSDMAVGAGWMLNIDLPVNFDSPYKAVSIRDFWKRWHISLTKFFTKNVYIPLGGSRKGEARTYINTLIVFLISGIWHGANWTFILWGLLHGLLSCMDRLFEKIENKVPKILRWGVTFAEVNLLMLLVSSDSVRQWWWMLRKIISFESLHITREYLSLFTIPEIQVVLKLLGIRLGSSYGMNMLIFVIAAFAICLIPGTLLRKKESNGSLIITLASALAFIWGVLSLGSESVFVYFGF